MDRTLTGRIKIAAATAFSVALLSTAYIVLADQPKRWGPIKCNSCDLMMPYPSAFDETILRAFVKDPYRGQIVFFGDRVDIGDVITICTQTACVDYTRNTSGNFEGGNPRKVQSGGGGGGGGLEDGDPGGGFGGPDCSVRPRTGTACTEANGIRRCETFNDNMVDCGFG
ncbi:hypothetical protein [Stenotrophomonas geniculata]|uniref:hypothetical protein n=1 Tax=Stenotrophomonas geniculata TaxID=86188 RepID=UPI001110C501|nr:hypothetical protein [Stenotrophomonas geniculata]